MPSYSREVKYIVITLNERPNWNTFIERMTEKARISIRTCRDMIEMTLKVHAMELCDRNLRN